MPTTNSGGASGYGTKKLPKQPKLLRSVPMPTPAQQAAEDKKIINAREKAQATAKKTRTAVSIRRQKRMK